MARYALDIDIQTKLSGVSEQGLFRKELPFRAIAVLAGCVLGLSAPGLEQWYLPWFAVVPLLVLTATASEPWTAGVRGWFFGTAYNLVYMSWYLSIRPSVTEGTFTLAPMVVNVCFWLMMSAWQGLFLSLFPCFLKAIPLTGGWLPVRSQKQWLMPALIVVPLLWIAIDRLCNAPLFLGVPWTSLEYSQYRQLPILQSASLIGGAGICACILIANTTLVSLFSFKRPGLRAFAYPSRASMLANTLVSLNLLLGLLTFGVMRIESHKLNQSSTARTVSVSAVQANLSSRIHDVPKSKIISDYVDLSLSCPKDSLIIWPEWSLDADFTRDRQLVEETARKSAMKSQSWIMGAYDHDGDNREFNSVCAADDKGTVMPSVYHKRYLVPFGEFIPRWAKDSLIGVIMYGRTDNFPVDTTPDDKVVTFKTAHGVVGPMLCFECLMPQLSADSVRKGAEILVDCSNTCWFFSSILSDQMISFCTLRAAENHRSFVLSSGLGPSTLIDSIGTILQSAPRDKPATVTQQLPLETDITPFNRYSF